MVKKGVWIILGIIVISILIILAIFYLPSHPKAFTKTSLLKSTIGIGEESFSEIKITNTKDNALDFNVYLTGMDGLASLSESNFALDPGSSRMVRVYFKDTKEEVNMYIGKLVIEADSLREEIPVILSTEGQNPAFAIISNPIPKYGDVYIGEKLGVDIKVFDLIGVPFSTIQGNFYIKDFDNNVLFSDFDTLVVGGSKSKLVDIPQNWEKGDYILITSIEYKGNKIMSGYLFTVLEKGDDSLPNNVKIILIMVFVFFAVILSLFFYFVKTRDEFLMQLKRQQSEEMIRNMDYLRRSREIIQSSKEAPQKKEIKLIKLNQLKRKVVKRIKKKQKEQLEKLKELKKKNKKPLLKSELSKWKADGYKMFETENEVKKITKKSMEKQIKNWKKKGYSTEFLKNKKNL